MRADGESRSHPGLWGLVYLASAVDEWTEEQLLGLLRGSRERNASAGVTGMLIYHDGVFMQVMEGPREAVLGTFERVCANERIRLPLPLLQGPRDARAFAAHSLAFRAVGRRVAADGYVSAMNGTPPPLPAGTTDPYLRLVDTFIATQLRLRGRNPLAA